MQAREFLAHQGANVRERNLFKQPLTPAEIMRLAKRGGGIRNLVAPKRREEAEAIPDAQLPAWLAEDPGRIRRPIIDTGDDLHLGFTKAVREALS